MGKTSKLANGIQQALCPIRLGAWPLKPDNPVLLMATFNEGNRSAHNGVQEYGLFWRIFALRSVGCCSVSKNKALGNGPRMLTFPGMSTCLYRVVAEIGLRHAFHNSLVMTLS